MFLLQELQQRAQTELPPPLRLLCCAVLRCVVLQVVFVSSCSSVWDCGSVALDDISLSQGDCELTEGRKHGRRWFVVLRATIGRRSGPFTASPYLESWSWRCCGVVALQPRWRPACQDTATSRAACAASPRTNTPTPPTGSAGGAPPPPPTLGPLGTTPQGSVRPPAGHPSQSSEKEILE